MEFNNDGWTVRVIPYVIHATNCSDNTGTWGCRRDGTIRNTSSKKEEEDFTRTFSIKLDSHTFDPIQE